MGKTKVDWKSVQRELKKTSFTNSVLAFDSESIKESAREAVTKKYLSKKEWNLKKIDYSSKACGPLAKWGESQVR